MASAATMKAIQRQPMRGGRGARPSGLGGAGVPRPSGAGWTFQPRGSRSIRRSLEPVALLLPGVGVVVVAVELPEALAVLAHHLELAQELRGLPEVALGNEEPQRRAMVVLQGSAVVGVRDEDVVVVERGERQVRRVVAVAV